MAHSFMWGNFFHANGDWGGNSLPIGLCPDWDSWDASKPVNNAREAMQQADDWLGIPQVSCDYSELLC